MTLTALTSTRPVLASQTHLHLRDTASGHPASSSSKEAWSQQSGGYSLSFCDTRHSRAHTAVPHSGPPVCAVRGLWGRNGSSPAGSLLAWLLGRPPSTDRRCEQPAQAWFQEAAPLPPRPLWAQGVSMGRGAGRFPSKTPACWGGDDSSLLLNTHQCPCLLPQGGAGGQEGGGEEVGFFGKKPPN